VGYDQFRVRPRDSRNSWLARKGLAVLRHRCISMGDALVAMARIATGRFLEAMLSLRRPSS
jgi:hypothetical protein